MDEGGLAWTVTDRETAYECPGFDIVREVVSLPDGKTTDFDYLVEPPSVVILPFTPDHEVVVVEEWRHAVRRVNRGLPAGTAESGDADLQETARRELREETGYSTDRITPLLTVEPANGLAAIEHHYFVAQDCEYAGPQRLDDDETIHVKTIPYEDLLGEAIAGEMRDGRSMLGILYYHTHNP